MRVDPSQYVVGDEWAYRARDNAPSERVRIVSVTPGKQSVRVEVAFSDDPQRKSETVPGSRLRVRWEGVEAYDALMANWQRIDDCVLDEVEQSCVGMVFELLVPADIAELEWSSVRDATGIRDLEGLASLIGLKTKEILAAGPWFEHDGAIMLSRTGTLAIAEAACRHTPMPVLNWVVEQETELRHKCKHGSERRNYLTGEPETTSPQWEYHWYLSHHRPRHELLRQWCGHRAVTFQERLIAAEAEARRLDLLVTELIAALERAGDKTRAIHFSDEHEQDRITPEKSRPVVDRPLDLSEIPVREVPRRRRWGG
ncbi:hypothetical protein Cs7R123_79520 [Catellatospora sp. TT07R-123]|uniref:hypothetical protein n=1 Tax=Catellatospora sp. TT07R-123 TaxID=2733863 RepID=UPI001B0860A6|nr:hypothetical protein [Catellatospora sp. TT07R-123]GHJ50610.1 hypothetical protein Cs7R123_79520 [Catellatospora sp. TT07R-123]